ncbi:MAG: hypothetical protein K6F94_09585 [Bacteroidaceae bacterium]|nr:hypothetical protein [Bacteroidaceae bacterium]
MLLTEEEQAIHYQCDNSNPKKHCPIAPGICYSTTVMSWNSHTVESAIMQQWK